MILSIELTERHSQRKGQPCRSDEILTLFQQQADPTAERTNHRPRKQEANSLLHGQTTTVNVLITS